MFWSQPKSQGQKAWMSAPLTTFKVEIHHGDCFQGVHMQKQLLQSIYFRDESVPSFFSVLLTFNGSKTNSVLIP